MGLADWSNALGAKILELLWSRPVLAGVVILIFSSPLVHIVLFFSPLLVSTALCVIALVSIGPQIEKIREERQFKVAVSNARAAADFVAHHRQPVQRSLVIRQGRPPWSRRRRNRRWVDWVKGIEVYRDTICISESHFSSDISEEGMRADFSDEDGGLDMAEEDFCGRNFSKDYAPCMGITEEDGEWKFAGFNKAGAKKSDPIKDEKFVDDINAKINDSEDKTVDKIKPFDVQNKVGSIDLSQNACLKPRELGSHLDQMKEQRVNSWVSKLANEGKDSEMFVSRVSTDVNAFSAGSWRSVETESSDWIKIPSSDWRSTYSKFSSSDWRNGSSTYSSSQWRNTSSYASKFGWFRKRKMPCVSKALRRLRAKLRKEIKRIFS